MDLLERYLLQIERYLPRKDKQDVIEELRSLILDQLDGDLSDQKVKDIITSFGSPFQVASRYRNDKPLILREFEPIMMVIFKIIAISVPSALIFANILESYGSTQNVTTLDILFNILLSLPSIAMAVVTGFGVVFIIFTGISQSPNVTIPHEQFNPDHLPPVPEDIYKTKRIENILGLIFSFVFLYIFNLQPGLVAVYYNNTREPLLNSNFDSILPYLNISIIFSMTIHFAHLVMNSKTKLSVTFEAIHLVFSGIILILLANADIFNPIIIEGYELTVLRTLFTIGMYVGAFGSFIGAIVLIVRMFLAKEKR